MSKPSERAEDHLLRRERIETLGRHGQSLVINRSYTNDDVLSGFAAEHGWREPRYALECLVSLWDDIRTTLPIKVGDAVRMTDLSSVEGDHGWIPYKDMLANEVGVVGYISYSPLSRKWVYEVFYRPTYSVDNKGRRYDSSDTRRFAAIVETHGLEKVNA